MNLAKMLEEVSEDDLKLWLNSGFRDNDWAPLTFDLIPAVSVQIQSVFEQARAATQEKLRRAVVRAIAEWTPNRPRVLASLCMMAGYTKATRAAPILKQHILKRLVEREHDPEYRHALAAAIGTLAGLAPHPDASDAIETLYYKEEVPPRYAAQLLHGMLRIDSGNFPRYLPHFVDLATKHAPLFRLDIIVDRLVKEVTPERFAEHYPRLSPHTRNLLDWLLPQAGMYFNPDEKAIAVGSDSEAIRANIDVKMKSRADQTSFASFLGVTQ
ncbi:MAG: hypothetical protein ACXW5U_11485 [Thermoanaerobaculia bacterium]